MKVENFIKDIEVQVVDGERLLQNLGLRSRIEFILKEQGIPPENAQTSPMEFMISLTEVLLSTLANPAHEAVFGEISTCLNPLQRIKDIVSGNDFDQVVRVRPANVITDRRITMSAFVKALKEYLRRDKGTVERTDIVGTRSRRIQGFAPQPGDDERPK